MLYYLIFHHLFKYSQHKKTLKKDFKKDQKRMSSEICGKLKIFRKLNFQNLNFRTQVIPQLIARIDTPRQLVSRLIIQLLMDIGKQHPQAIVYPLTVVTKSTIQARSVAANMILKSMCEHSNRLVQQSMLVRNNLLLFFKFFIVSIIELIAATPAVYQQFDFLNIFYSRSVFNNW